MREANRIFAGADFLKLFSLFQAICCPRPFSSAALIANGSLFKTARKKKKRREKEEPRERSEREGERWRSAKEALGERGNERVIRCGSRPGVSAKHYPKPRETIHSEHNIIIGRSVNVL